VDVLSGLNQPQRQAVTHVTGPLLVLAGAGSGKTRVITRRVAHLIQQGAAPWQVLAITFTNKAAGEMRDRVHALSAPHGATVCTFHSLCARLLREFAAEAGISGDYSIYDRADQIRIVKQAMRDAGIPPENLPPPRVHAAISNAKNQLLTPEAFADRAENFHARKVAAVYAHYQRILAAGNALDFDDLLLRTAMLLRDRPEIRRQLGERYQYVLIDEYQDTNRAQYVIAHGIAMDHRNVCATGDPDQSIYAWRGADISNILEFETDYPDALVVRLEENYRSTAPILAAASRLIARNTERRPKKLWTSRTGGVEVRVLRCDDEDAEASEIARGVAAARRDGYEPRDIAVFYRINALSRVLEKTFRREDLAYRIARGVAFYNRKEIKDVLAYLKLIVNPADDLSCLRIINTPPRGIGAATVKRLIAYAQRRSIHIIDACRGGAEAGLAAGAARKTAAFADMIAAFATSPIGDVRSVTEHVCDTSGLTGHLRKRADADAEGETPLLNVEQLISEAAEFDQDSAEGTLADYLHQVSLVSDVDHFEGAGGAVTFMTLHAAKGLEFPVVFVVGCEEGILPLARPDAGRTEAVIENLEEERRLAFVGITRAKDRLILTCAESRRVRGLIEAQAASRFLDELEGDGVVVEDRTAPAPAPAAAGLGGSHHRSHRRAPKGFYADVDQRALIEAIADADNDFPPEYQYLKPGCRVHHPKFGLGTVLTVRQPWPKTRADVQFQTVGRKTLVVAIARLELIDHH